MLAGVMGWSGVSPSPGRISKLASAERPFKTSLPKMPIP